MPSCHACGVHMCPTQCAVLASMGSVCTRLCHWVCRHASHCAPHPCACAVHYHGQGNCLSSLLTKVVGVQSSAKQRAPVGLDMTVNVLTSGYWPSYPLIDARMPAELSTSQQVIQSQQQGPACGIHWHMCLQARHADLAKVQSSTKSA